MPLHHHHKYVGGLSPVQESPEYKPEEINYQELEKDLNLALSKLNSEINELPSDLTEETQITHTVTVTNTQQRPPSEEEDDSLFQGNIWMYRINFLPSTPNCSLIAFKL